MSKDLAQRIIRLVHSRTWVTLPGEEVRSVWFMVWMESIITRSGFSVRMCSATSWASVSVRMRRLGLCTPRRLARSLICLALSLAGDVEHPQALAQVFADLQEDGGLADARVAADEHQGALDDAAPQHPVQLGEAGVVPLLVGGADLVDGHGVGDDPRGPGPGAPLGQGGLLYRFLHGVPLPAAGALSPAIWGTRTRTGCTDR